MPQQDRQAVGVGILMADGNAATTTTTTTTEAVAQVSTGMQVAGALLNVDTSTLDTVVNACDKLGKVFTAANGAFALFTIIKGMKEGTELQKLRDELIGIHKVLDQIGQDIRDGFTKLIAHGDFEKFREAIATPVETVFESFLRCVKVPDSITFDKLKNDCKEKMNPDNLLITIHTFLDPKDNIMKTQLEANECRYETYRIWRDTLYRYVFQLMITNMFYFGLLKQDAKEIEREAFSKQQVSAMTDIVKKIDQRFEDIEIERLRSFHKGKHGEKVLREEMAKILVPFPAPDSGEERNMWNKDYLMDMAIKLKNNWPRVNGKHPFYIALSRGRAADNVGTYVTHYYNGDDSSVTVVPNIAYEKKGRPRGDDHDGICAFLIQPYHPGDLMDSGSILTRAMRDKFKIERIEKWGPIQEEVLKECPSAKLLILQLGSRIHGEKTDGSLQTFNYGPLYGHAQDGIEPPCYYRVIKQAGFLLYDLVGHLIA